MAETTLAKLSVSRAAWTRMQDAPRNARGKLYLGSTSFPSASSSGRMSYVARMEAIAMNIVRSAKCWPEARTACEQIIAQNHKSHVEHTWTDPPPEIEGPGVWV